MHADPDAPMNGRAVAEEMIRQACLWDVLTENGKAATSVDFWKYKRTHLDTCNSTALAAQNTSAEKCAETVRPSPSVAALPLIVCRHCSFWL